MVSTDNEEESRKVCPECGHVFRGNGWGGIDAHWRAKHERELNLAYEGAWPSIKAGTYRRKDRKKHR